MSIRRAPLFLIALALTASALVWAFRPVCLPLDAQPHTTFTPPLEERTDRDFYVRVFQQREGQWLQCKTWLSRQFFF